MTLYALHVKSVIDVLIWLQAARWACSTTWGRRVSWRLHQSQISKENYKTIGGHGTKAKKTFHFSTEDSAGTLHDLVHRRKANVPPNETEITSKLQQNATQCLVTRHSNGQLVVRTSDTMVFSRSCEPVVVRLSLSCRPLEEENCLCSPILKKMY